jgi:hypothetical protein
LHQFILVEKMVEKLVPIQNKQKLMMAIEENEAY